MIHLMLSIIYILFLIFHERYSFKDNQGFINHIPWTTTSFIFHFFRCSFLSLSTMMMHWLSQKGGFKFKEFAWFSFFFFLFSFFFLLFFFVLFSSSFLACWKSGFGIITIIFFIFFILFLWSWERI